MSNDLAKTIESFRNSFGSILGDTTKTGRSFSDWWSINSGVDIQRDEDRIYYLIDLPGVNEKDIQITQEGSMVNISAERKNRSTHSTYQTSFTVDTKEVDINSLEAMLDSGVLTISFTYRKPETKPEARKITVKSMR